MRRRADPALQYPRIQPRPGLAAAEGGAGAHDNRRRCRGAEQALAVQRRLQGSFTLNLHSHITRW